MNSGAIGRVTPPTVICRSSIASSRADCTLAGARLISSASTRLPNSGPCWNSMRWRPSASCCSTSAPVMSEGSRSGVNWMRRMVASRCAASALTVRVLARPGRLSSNTWPSASRATSTWRITAACPSTAADTACSNATMPSRLAMHAPVCIRNGPRRRRRARAGRAPGARRARAGRAPGARRARAGRAPGARRARAGRAPGARRARAGRAPGARRARAGRAPGARRARAGRAPGARRLSGWRRGLGGPGPASIARASSPFESPGATWD
ncbi:Uncharacterised protein [Bordetella pertussis]|nr:Uncharacterised protein [Bordetella pertussis]